MADMIEIKHLNKYFGDLHVLKDINLTVKRGEKLVMIGPSGSGKSTLIRCVDYLEEPASGEVVIDGTPLTKKNHLEMARKYSSMVFQQFNLFPHLSVKKNVMLAQQKVLKRSKEEAEKIAVEELTKVGLAERIDFMPSQLSGGQQQRVAIARALAMEPEVLLFDEPLSNLDAKLRVSMRTEIRRIQQEVGITAIYVTHDQSEAMALSDQIIIMNKGVVAQIGTPQEIYYHPVSEFVADFIGEANFLKGRLEALSDNRAQLNVSGDICHAAPVPGMEVGRDYTIVLRPEAASLAEEGGLPCEVVLSCFMGSYQNYHVKVGDTLVKLTDPNPKNKRIYKVGERCHLVFDPESVHVL